ncbi:olfactory receptor 5V1-like [Lissotriton helveticus]
MKEDNLSSMEEFLIVGFSDFPQLKVPLFIAFLLIYLITVMGNLLIMTTVYSNSLLHTPMYFFITNLSFIEITYSSIIFLPMLAHFFLDATHVSLMGCLLQTYLFMVMVVTEVLLLTVMAYDRYVAICNPLRYTAIMNKAACMGMAAGCWIVGSTVPVPHIVQMSYLSFCGSHRINHFFCDVTALIKISCSSTHVIEILTYTLGEILPLSFFLIITSYVKIFSSILKIKSKGGRHKALSTCGSHLTVVILFYGSVCTTYMRPTSTFSVKDNKLISLSYIAVTPLSNPFIYSLKNKEFLRALRRQRVNHEQHVT